VAASHKLEPTSTLDGIDGHDGELGHARGGLSSSLPEGSIIPPY